MTTSQIVLVSVIVALVAIGFVLDIIYIFRRRKKEKESGECDSCYKGQAMLSEYKARKKKEKKNALKFKRELEKADKRGSEAR